MACCKKCGYEFAQGFSVPPTLCGDCDESTPDFQNHLSQFEPYYDTGLGCHIRSRKHKQRVMAEKGVIEVGNEFEKHLRGKWVNDQTERELCSKQEVTEKLSEIRHKFEYDPSYRRRYEGGY